MPAALVPEPYQLQAAEFIVSRTASALWAEMGIGKTISALLAVSTLRATGKVRRTLIVAPLLVATTVWPAELDKWPEFRELKYRLLRDKDLEGKLPPVLIVNYEMLSWFTGWDYLQANVPEVPTDLDKNATVAAQIRREALVKREFRKGLKRLLEILEVDMLVLDECTRVKSTKSKVHEFVREMSENIKYVVGLTGTPAADHIDDVFGQLLVIDKGASLGAYVTHFRGRYFTKVNPRDVYSPLVLQPGALERIYTDIKDTVLRIGAAGNIKLPEIVYRARRFELSRAEAAAYADMESTLITEDPRTGELFVAAAAVAAQSKLMQLTGGAIYRNPVDPITGEPVVHTDKYTTFGTSKLEQMEQMLDELAEEQVLIVYWFRHERERLLKRIKGVGVLNGTKQDADVINDWNRGRLRRLALHPASAGHGLNLPGLDAHHVVMYSTPWSNELLLQVCARLRRRGNEAETIFVHQLVARGTIDEVVARDKTAKSRRQEKLFTLLAAAT